MFLELSTAAFGVFFLFNGSNKVRRYRAFRQALRHYDLWSRNLTAIAWAWIVLEIAAGGWLLTGEKTQFLPVAAALGLATGAISRRLWQRRDHDCGCSSKPHKISGALIAKNLVLALAVAACAYFVEGAAASAWTIVLFCVAVTAGAATVGHPSTAIQAKEA